MRPVIEMAAELVYELNEGDDWITDCFEELVDKYEGEWIAVVGEKEDFECLLSP